MSLWLRILVCIVVIVLSGSLSGILTAGAIENWYQNLEQPPGVPPNWVFGPVWTILYVMIGLSLALFWHRAEPGREKRGALTLFAVQMVLNLAWTPVFFGMHRIGLALAVIAVLLVSVIGTIVLFRRKDRTAGNLLIPYALWVGYATYLNAGFLVCNR